MILDNSVVVFIMKPVMEFISTCKAIDYRSIGLSYMLGYIF